MSLFGPAIIIGIDDLTADIKEFELKTDLIQSFNPGQYILVKKNDLVREFSISSSPRNNSLNITVRRVGRLTSWLHGRRVGDEICISSPQPTGGGFTQQYLQGKNLWFIAAGIGITGLAAQIDTIIENSENFGQDIRLFWGNRHLGNRFWSHRLKNWQKYLKIITNQEANLLEQVTRSKPIDDTLALVCGSAKFFAAAENRLIQIGFKPNKILSDVWE